MTKTLRPLRDVPYGLLLDLSKSRSVFISTISHNHNRHRKETHSLAASLSNLLICSLVSLTASLALASARSASLSAAWTFITLSLSHCNDRKILISFIQEPGAAMR